MLGEWHSEPEQVRDSAQAVCGETLVQTRRSVLFVIKACRLARLSLSRQGDLAQALRAIRIVAFGPGQMIGEKLARNDTDYG